MADQVTIPSSEGKDPQMYEEKANERMDKADILELTVEFLRENRQGASLLPYNGIMAEKERLSNDSLNDSRICHRTPPPPAFVPYGYPILDWKI